MALCQHRLQWAGGPSGSNRVKRGGSFDNDADNLRVSNRNDDNPSDDNDNDGFRCASSRHRQTGRLQGRGLRAGRDHRLPSRAGAIRTKSSPRAGSRVTAAPCRGGPGRLSLPLRGLAKTISMLHSLMRTGVELSGVEPFGPISCNHMELQANRPSVSG